MPVLPASRRACDLPWPRGSAAPPQRSIGDAVWPHARRTYVSTAAISASLERFSVRRHQPHRSFLAVQQNANRNARIANDGRRAGDVGRGPWLLAPVGAVAPFAQVFVDLLPGRESLSDRRRSAPRRPAPCPACRAIPLARALSRRDRRARRAAPPQRSARARDASIDKRTACSRRRRWAGPRLRARPETRARRRVHRVRRGTFRTAHSDRPHPGSAVPGIVAPSSATSAPLSSADALPGRARCFGDPLHQRLHGRVRPHRLHDRCGKHRDRRRPLRRFDVRPAAGDRARPARCRADPLSAASIGNRIVAVRARAGRDRGFLCLRRQLAERRGKLTANGPVRVVEPLQHRALNGMIRLREPSLSEPQAPTPARLCSRATSAGVTSDRLDGVEAVERPQRLEPRPRRRRRSMPTFAAPGRPTVSPRSTSSCCAMSRRQPFGCASTGTSSRAAWLASAARVVSRFVLSCTMR